LFTAGSFANYREHLILSVAVLTIFVRRFTRVYLPERRRCFLGLPLRRFE
jgi:hypothetical protein